MTLTLVYMLTHLMCPMAPVSPGAPAPHSGVAGQRGEGGGAAQAQLPAHAATHKQSLVSSMVIIKIFAARWS